MNTYQAIQERMPSILKAHKATRAIRHKLRLNILAMLQERQMTVTELYVRLRLEQSVCSQHLAILRKAGIVKTSRVGKYVYYSIDETAVAGLLEAFASLN